MHPQFRNKNTSTHTHVITNQPIYCNTRRWLLWGVCGVLMYSCSAVFGYCLVVWCWCIGVLAYQWLVWWCIGMWSYMNSVLIDVHIHTHRHQSISNNQNTLMYGCSCVVMLGCVERGWLIGLAVDLFRCVRLWLVLLISTTHNKPLNRFIDTHNYQ